MTLLQKLKLFYYGLLALIAILFAVVLRLYTPFETTPLIIGLVILTAAALAAYVAWVRYQARLTLARDTDLLQGAAWDLVRLMENFGLSSAGRRAAGRADLVERFSVEGAGKVNVGRLMPMGDHAGIDLTNVSLALLDRDDKDSSGHWTKVNGARRGAYAFYALFRLGNPQSAFLALIEHMKQQRNEAERGTRSMANHTELKMAMGLPTLWPTGTAPEQVERKGPDELRMIALMRAVTLGREYIFRGIEHTPWPVGGVEQPTYRGEEILDAMRAYIK